MPRMDGTGPMGMGPMTGWGRGVCAGGADAGWGMRRGYGWGMGYGGFGRGMGFCRTAADDKDVLMNQKAWLEKSLKNVNDRLEKL